MELCVHGHCGVEWHREINIIAASAPDDMGIAVLSRIHIQFGAVTKFVLRIN